jgi:hypothetical protein
MKQSGGKVAIALRDLSINVDGNSRRASDLCYPIKGRTFQNRSFCELATAANVCFARRVQLIAATHSANFSAGV